MTLNFGATFSFFKTFINFRLFTVFILGFSSGLPLFLTGSTLQTWYAAAGINIIAIGCLSLVGQPYIYKFFWAPLMDRYRLSFLGLGRRRGWMLLTQIGLVGLLMTMAFMDPGKHPYETAFLALITAFFSASQDINVDAYRAEILRPEELGIGAAASVAGYRLAMLVSGGAALILAETLSWKIAYFIMAALMGIGILGSLFAPAVTGEEKIPTTLVNAVLDPFREFISRPYAIILLVFLFFYKISFEFSLILTPTFLFSDLGFSLVQIGTINKGLGLITTLLGIFIGGFLLKSIGLFRSLLFFGFFHAVSLLGYVFLAGIGKVYSVMVVVVSMENFCAGMETAAFVSFLMSLCHRSYTATQFALFSAFGAASRIVAGPIAGVLVAKWGWQIFYLWTALFVLPALLILFLYRRELFSTYTIQPVLGEI